MVKSRNRSATRPGVAFAAGACLLGIARPVVAAKGAAGGGSSSLEVVLILVAVVGVAYLFAHLLFERIAERFGIVTGVEYIVLGAIVFQFIIAPILPGAEGVSATERIDLLFEQLRPVLVLGTGSLGLLWGTHVDIRNRDEFDRTALRPALIISSTTFGLVAAVPAAAIAYFYSIDRMLSVAPALVFAGSVALVAADAPIRTMEAFLKAEGDAPEVAYRIANICSSLAIIAFGILFSFDNTGDLIREGTADWMIWIGIHVLVGVALGVVFGTFLRKDFSDEKILTVVIGMVVFTSGIAHGLHLSPIFVNFILGVVLINTSRHGDHVREMLESIKHPLYIVLFIFAGAQLDLSVPIWAYGLAIPYLLLRFAGRWMGGLLAPTRSDGQPPLPNLGRILFAPGGLSIALALDFLMVYAERGATSAGLFFGTGHDVEAVFTGLVVAIIASEVLAHTMTRRWLIDASDVKTTHDAEGDETTSTATEGA